MPKDTFFNLPEAKRTAIIDILLEEFADNDYNRVSVARIVDRAGIAKGSFYQYFEDKADCYLYLIQLGMDEKIAFLQQSPPPDSSMDLFAYLQWLVTAGVQFEFSNPRLAKIGYRAVFDDVPLPEETLQVIRQSGKDYFKQLVSEGMETGTIRPDVDPDLAAFMLNAIFTNLGEYLLSRFAIDPVDLLNEGSQTFEQLPAHEAMTQVIEIMADGLRA